MTSSPKPNLLKQLLQQKTTAEAGRRTRGILADRDLARQFRPGEAPQPIIRRGGRNGSGKP